MPPAARRRGCASRLQGAGRLGQQGSGRRRCRSWRWLHGTVPSTVRPAAWQPSDKAQQRMCPGATAGSSLLPRAIAHLAVGFEPACTGLGAEPVRLAHVRPLQPVEAGADADLAGRHSRLQPRRPLLAQHPHAAGRAEAGQEGQAATLLALRRRRRRLRRGGRRMREPRREQGGRAARAGCRRCRGRRGRGGPLSARRRRGQLVVRGGEG